MSNQKTAKVILDLCQALEKHLDKRLYHTKNDDDKAWEAGCRWLGTTHSTPPGIEVVPEETVVTIAKQKQGDPNCGFCCDFVDAIETGKCACVCHSTEDIEITQAYAVIGLCRSTLNAIRMRIATWTESDAKTLDEVNKVASNRHRSTPSAKGGE